MSTICFVGVFFFLPYKKKILQDCAVLSRLSENLIGGRITKKNVCVRILESLIILHRWFHYWRLKEFRSRRNASSLHRIFFPFHSARQFVPLNCKSTFLSLKLLLVKYLFNNFFSFILLECNLNWTGENFFHKYAVEKIFYAMVLYKNEFANWIFNKLLICIRNIFLNICSKITIFKFQVGNQVKISFTAKRKWSIN